ICCMFWIIIMLKYEILITQTSVRQVSIKYSDVVISVHPTIVDLTNIPYSMCRHATPNHQASISMLNCRYDVVRLQFTCR
ncbi:hypothetical protein BCV71DRAFT_184078, partial [Rhizopus microsporus]